MTPAALIDIALFAAYVASSSLGLVLIKRALDYLRETAAPLFALSPYTLTLAGGISLYVISFALWIRILERLPLSTAYPIAIGLTMAFSTSGAVLVLGERLGVLKLAGLALVFAGCTALSLESR